MSFRGEEFVAIDSDAFGDGQTDTQTIDTWLQNRIAGNSLNIAEGLDAFTISYISTNVSLTANTGDRPWAALNWISVARGVLPDWNGLEGVDLSFLYNVQCASGTQEDAQLRFVVGGKVVEATLNNTYSAGPSYGVAEFSVNLDEVLQSDDDRTIPFEIWMQSVPGDDTGTTHSVQPQVFGLIETSAVVFFNDSTSGNPDTNSLEVMYVKIPTLNGETQALDMLGYGGQGPGGLGDDRVVVHGKVENLNGTPTAELAYLSYLQIRAIRIKPRLSKESVGRISKIALAPRREFGSAEALRQAHMVRRLEARRRVLAIGPRGKLETAETYSGIDYPTRWEWNTGLSSKNIISEPVMLRTEDPYIDVYLEYIALHLHQSEGLDDGLAVWDITADVTTLDGGEASWAAAVSIGSTTSEIAAPLVPATTIHPSPFIRAWNVIPFVDAADPGFFHKEGSLFDADVELVRRTKVRVPVSGFDTVGRVPNFVRVDVDVDLNATEPVTYCSGTDIGPAFLRWVCVGYTIVEVPR